jgi:hypothetical protein
MLAVLQDWPNLPVPARYAQRFEGVEPGRWQRQAKALYLIVSWGLCARIEVEHLLSQFDASDEKRPTAVRQALDHLEKLKLVLTHRLQVRDALDSSLVIFEPTESGLTLCRYLGFPERPPEFPRIASLLPGEAQQLAALALSIQARQRGYLALPAPPGGGVQPDAYIERAGALRRVCRRGRR